MACKLGGTKLALTGEDNAAQSLLISQQQEWRPSRNQPRFRNQSQALLSRHNQPKADRTSRFLKTRRNYRSRKRSRRTSRKCERRQQSRTNYPTAVAQKLHGELTCTERIIFRLCLKFQI